MRPRGHVRRVCLCAGLLAFGAAAGRAAELPPPPTAGTQMPAATLYLELVVNARASGQVVPVLVRDGHYYLSAALLRTLHVRLDGSAQGLVAVDQVPGVTVQYDSIGQRLLIALPPDWLPAQEVGRAGMAQFTPVGGQGFLINYDLYAGNLGREGAYASIWSEQRYFSDWGIVSNTGVYRRTLSGNGNGTNAFDAEGNRYVRYDTRWSWSDTERVRTFTAGDLITGALPWGNAVRIGGVQIARNFAVRPDLIPYPLPKFSGQAAVPSAVDLFINGYKTATDNVLPGPFTLNTMPFINGAGEAAVVTTDALGRQVMTTVPFYVANTLLKTDTTDYSLAFGALRRDYGVKNFSYGGAAATGSYRYGLNDALTLEGRGEMARDFALGGIGAVTTLGQFGVVNGSVAHSHTPVRDGQQWTVGYQYNARRFGVGAQHTRRTPGYTDLGTVGLPELRLTRRSTQITGSGSLGEWGALSAAYFDVTAGDGDRTRLAAVSYSRPLGARSFFSVNLNKVIGRPGHSVQLQWTLLLDAAGSVSVVSTRDRGSQATQVQYSRSPPPAGGLGWNLSYANSGGPNDYRQASATWRNDLAQVQAGAYTQSGRSTSWAGATGSVVVMDGGLFAANRINDAFALVSTGVPDVPVRFENQTLGRTNDKGHLLVTGVNAYYPARFEIDTLDLPDYMQVTRGEQRIVLRAGSGALVRFEIEQVLAATIKLVDADGRPLPIGLQVQHVDSGRTAIVGYDGITYLEGLQRDNELLVQGADFPGCRVRFTLDAATPQVVRVGPLVCRATPATASLELWRLARYYP
jgi:outer membrane usher protein